MELNTTMVCPYKVKVLYVDDSFNGDREIESKIDVHDFEFDDTKDFLKDHYALELDLEPEQFEIDLYVDEEELENKKQHLKEWEEWRKIHMDAI